MKLTDVLAWSLIGAFALGGSGCTKDNLEEKVRTGIITINQQQYKFENDIIKQISSDPDTEARYGVLADTHGNDEAMKIFVRYFKEKSVDGIIVAGDIAQHFRNNAPDDEEIKKVIEELAKSRLPVYVIPGNHDLKKDYQKAMAELAPHYPNIINMSKIRFVDGDDADIVSCPLMDDHFSMAYGEGFIGDCFDMGKWTALANNQVVLVSHRPPKGTGAQVLDYVPQIQRNVGDEQLAMNMQKYKVSVGVFGHIHEAGGKATTFSGEVVSPETYSSELLLNPGPASPWSMILATGKSTSGMAGVLTVKDGKAKYEIFSLE